MLDKESLIDEVNERYKPEYVPLLRSHLEGEGFTAQELTDLDSMIQTFTEDLPKEDFVSALGEVEAESISDMETSFATEAMRQESVAAEQKAITEAKGHETFNAENAIKLPEPKFSEPKETSPVDLIDCDYSLTDDYPESYGFIDDGKNWIKVNNRKMSVEVVTSSGTRIKVDKEGNATLFVAGSLKHIVEKDYSLEVRGNMDMLVHGNSYTHIKGTQESLIDKAVTWNFNNSLTHNVKSSVNTTYKSTFNLKVASAVKYDFGAMYEVTAALLNKNTAAMILLN